MRTPVTALALLLAAPAAAQDGEAAGTDFAALSDAELGGRLVAVRTEGFGNACAEKVPLFIELGRRFPRDKTRYDTGRLIAEAFCAYDEERYAEGLRALKRAEKSDAGVSGLDQLGLALAGQMEDGPEALARLRNMAESGQIANLPVGMIHWVRRAIHRAGLEAEADELAYDIATSPAFARLDPDVQAVFAYGALGHAATAGQTARVNELLSHVRSPSSVIDLLALRKYEPIWPQIEHHAGDNLANLSDAYVGWAATRMADKPEDRDRLSEYAYALLFAGRFREAVDLAQGWLDRGQHEGEIEEGDGWALNIQAYAYDALGQPGESDRVFDRLARLSPDEHPWVVNFLINRESRLIDLARWEEALAASEIARPAAAEHGTPYARMLVAGDRACAFHRLGRPDESARELEFVRTHAADAPIAAGKAMLCAGREDEAARLLAGILADETLRSSVLAGIQDERFDLFGVPSPGLRRTRDLLLTRPELRAEVLEHARVLPERFVPVAYLRRQQLATDAPGG